MRAPEDVPVFPPSAFVEKVLDLGLGSGAWTRRDFEERWGASSANRFVDDGKKFGWLLSPYQNAFYVPAARDLTIMSWLPDAQRRELGIGRALGATGLRSWCLSAWLANAGLDLGTPLFVTDLRGAEDADASVRARRGLPFPENLVVVPQLPPMTGPGLLRSVQLPRGKPKRIPSSAWVLDTNARATLAVSPEEPFAGGWATSDDPRVLRFFVSPSVEDLAWSVALVMSLRISRIEERLPEVWRQAAEAGERRQPKATPQGREKEFKRRVLTWLGTFGQPVPNSAWSSYDDTRDGPYLLVPDVLWKEVNAAAFARRFEDVARFGR